MSSTVQREAIVLKPRPFARYAGRLLLVPLLPQRPPLQPLPVEVWSRVLSMVIQDTSCQLDTVDKAAWVSGQWDLSLVCRQWKDISLPLLYNHCRISTLTSLRQFTSHLLLCDHKWDSIRRIPYSTPGRWVQSLDLFELVAPARCERYEVDTLLTSLFPVLPFLGHLNLSRSIRLSKRAMQMFAFSEIAMHIRVLKGVRYHGVFGSMHHEDDPLTHLVSCCEGLEELEVLGPGPEEMTMMISTPDSPPPSPTFPLSLSHLHSLTILSVPSSNLLLRLLHTPLPSLTHLVITPYGDTTYPASLVSLFLLAHGSSLKTLIFHTQNSWPTTIFPPPASLLNYTPNLSFLSIEGPLSSFTVLFSDHPLKRLCITRPTSEFRKLLELLLPRLPLLVEVRAKDVRWIKRGMSARALEAGVQGEMRRWKRFLGVRRIRMLDADGREADI